MSPKFGELIETALQMDLADPGQTPDALTTDPEGPLDKP